MAAEKSVWQVPSGQPGGRRVDPVVVIVQPKLLSGTGLGGTFRSQVHPLRPLEPRSVEKAMVEEDPAREGQKHSQGQCSGKIVKAARGRRGVGRVAGLALEDEGGQSAAIAQRALRLGGGHRPQLPHQLPCTPQASLAQGRPLAAKKKVMGRRLGLGLGCGADRGAAPDERPG